MTTANRAKLNVLTVLCAYVSCVSCVSYVLLSKIRDVFVWV